MNLQKYWENYISINLKSNKPWYFGLEDNWWWGMSKEQFIEEAILRKFRKTYRMEFGGGLGDVFLQIYRNGRYNILRDLHEEERAHIRIISHNPYCRELFDSHPKHHLFTIETFDYWGIDDDKFFRNKHNIGHFDRIHIKKDTNFEFYPSPKDKEVLNNIDGKFIVMSAIAGVENKSFPIEITESILDVCRDINIQVVGVGKNYVRNGKGQEINLEDYGFPSLVDKLTVSGVCELIRKSSGVICCHSAVNILAWKMRKPQLLLYPQYIYDEFISKKNEWAEGVDYPETIHGLFNSYSKDMIYGLLQIIEGFKTT